MPLLRPCRNTAAFELLPERTRTLDLDAAERALADAGYRRVVRAGVMLIMRAEVEVSVYRSAKVLIKTRDGDVARRVAEQMLSLLDEGPDLRVEGLDRFATAPRGPA